jgi:hypothetical protein
MSPISALRGYPNDEALPELDVRTIPPGNAPFPVELRVVAAAGWDSYATFFSDASVAAV